MAVSNARWLAEYRLVRWYSGRVANVIVNGKLVRTLLIPIEPYWELELLNLY